MRVLITGGAGFIGSHLAEALNRLSHAPEFRSRLGRAARARIEAEFTAEQMSVKTLEVYRKVVVG